MAAAYDGWRFGGNKPVGPCHASKQPAIKVSTGKQPLAGNLGAGDLPLGDEFVELAFPYAKVIGGFGGCQQLQTCALLHMPAQILLFDFFELSTPNARGSRVITFKWNLLVPSTCFCPPMRTSSRSYGCRLPLRCRPPFLRRSLACRL